MPGHRGGGGLLQRLVGEQPVRHISQPVELDGRLAAQSRCFDERGGALPEPFPDRRNVGQQTGVGQTEARHLCQCRDTRITAQVGDVGAGEAQDGLTPVIMTL